MSNPNLDELGQHTDAAKLIQRHARAMRARTYANAMRTVQAPPFQTSPQDIHQNESIKMSL